MPRLTNEVGLLPSLLDRLLDDEPDVSREPLSNRFQDLRRMKQAVVRDLEALLNTRQEALEELSPAFTEVRRSLLTYGLPDFTACTLLSLTDRNRIRRALEQAIAISEPRLERVRVTLDPPRQYEQLLRFRIEAWLRVEPAPEPVAFDAMLQLSTQEYTVQGRD
jgi:type VI secretion system protein ImpF